MSEESPLIGDVQAAIDSAVGRKVPERVRTYPDKEMFDALSKYEIRAIGRGPDFIVPVSPRYGIFSETLKKDDERGRVGMFLGNLVNQLQVLEYGAYASTFTLRNPLGEHFDFRGIEKYSTKDLARLKTFSELVDCLGSVMDPNKKKEFEVEVDQRSFLYDTDKESSFVPPYSEPGLIELKCRRGLNESLSITVHPMENAVYYDPTDSDQRLGKLAKRMKHATKRQLEQAIIQEYGTSDNGRNAERLEKLLDVAEENNAAPPYIEIAYSNKGSMIRLRGDLDVVDVDSRNTLGFRIQLHFADLSVFVPIIKNANTTDISQGVASQDTDIVSAT